MSRNCTFIHLVHGRVFRVAILLLPTKSVRRNSPRPTHLGAKKMADAIAP